MAFRGAAYDRAVAARERRLKRLADECAADDARRARLRQEIAEGKRPFNRWDALDLLITAALAWMWLSLAFGW